MLRHRMNQRYFGDKLNFNAPLWLRSRT